MTASRLDRARVRAHGRCFLALFAGLAAAATPCLGSAVEVCARPVCQPWSWGVLEVPVIVLGLDSLRVFGLEVTYNTVPLNLLGYRFGNATRDFYAFDVVETGNRIRVGGFDPDAFVSAGPDTLVTLVFAIAVTEGTADFTVGGFTDDLAGALGCTVPANWAAPAAPPNGFISVYPEGSPPTCCYPVADGTVLRVAARVAHATADGILGAEFRLEVSPPAPGAVLAWTPDTDAATSVGNPVQNSTLQTDAGVVITFGGCATSRGDEVLLGHLTVAGLTGEHELLVRRHQRTATRGLGCAYFGLCNALCTVGCMVLQGPDADPIIFRARINSPSCDASCGYVPVAPRTWSSVKQLYRDSGRR